MRKEIWGLALSVILSVSAFPAFSSDIPDEQYSFGRGLNSTHSPDSAPNYPSVYAWFHDNADIIPTFPMLSAYGEDGRRLTCGSIDSIECKDRYRFYYHANYPFCSNTQDSDCIEEVFAISENGKRIKASNVEYLPKNPIVVNQPSIYHPGGSSREIFDLPGITHKGGSTKYAIEVRNSNTFTIPDRENFYTGNPVTRGNLWGNNKDFFVKITPVNLKSGSYELPQNVNAVPRGYDMKCVVLDVDRCGMAQGFSEGYKFGVTIRMKDRIYGWLQGRLQDPGFESTDLPDGSKKITVTGFPVTVPSISGGGNCTDKLTPVLRARYPHMCGGNGVFEQFWNYTPRDGTAGLIAFQEWLPVLGEKATVMPTSWSFRNIKDDEFPTSGLRAGQCIVSATKIGIGGMVSTNATAFSSGPPVFNESTQSLDYKVAAPHLTSEGKVFRGYYNLKMTTEMARCIYGLKPIPMQATISIVTENGEKIVGTTIVKSDDEWVELSAANFEFSSPTLRVKFSEIVNKPQPTATPVATPMATPMATRMAVPKRSTITCVKAKLSKKISGINPKCPTGYKKKV
jgi:hypothetical protein